MKCMGMGRKKGSEEGAEETMKETVLHLLYRTQWAAYRCRHPYT